MNSEQNNQLEQSTSPSDIFGDDWQMLTQDWQAQPYKKSDIDKLLKQTKRRTLWAKAILALDVIATLFLIGASILGLIEGDWGTAVMGYLIAGSIFSVVFVYYEFKIRLGAWKKACDSPERAVTNALRGCESSIKYIKLIKISCWILIALVITFGLAFSQETGKPAWPIILEMSLMVLACYGITHWFHRKRKIEHSRIQQMLSKFHSET